MTGGLDIFGEAFAAAAEEYAGENDNRQTEDDRDDGVIPGVELPDGDVGRGDDEVAHVLDDLGHGVEHENFGGDGRNGGYHGNGVDDGGGKVSALDDDIPDLADVAEFDIESGEAEGKADR